MKNKKLYLHHGAVEKIKWIDQLPSPFPEWIEPDDKSFKLLPKSETSHVTLFLLMIAASILAFLALRAADMPNCLKAPEIAREVAKKGVAEAQSDDSAKFCTLKVVECDTDPSMEDELMRAISIAAPTWDVNPALLYGIAVAESSFGERMVGNNPFGMMDDGVILRFSSLEEAAMAAARLIKTRYYNEGLTTPDQIARKWLGYEDDGTWATTVNYYYNQN